MKILEYAKQSGPGWLQAAVTLGGGSLVGALYLGVIGGYQFMWLQPLAMGCGVIMLSAISYITLSTDERPFRSMQKRISPALAWAWLIGTIIADVVFCAAQFSLGRGAIEQNLGGGGLNVFVITGLFFAVGFVLIWLSASGKKMARFIDNLLKTLVAIIVLSFMGVVIKLSFAGAIDFGAILKGFIPNFSGMFRPAPPLAEAIAQTGEHAEFWTTYVNAAQRDIIITAFGTAVGINMTFLLPYTMMRRNWGKKERPLACIDMVFGLLIPFMLATTFLVIASASQFHANNHGVIAEDGGIAPEARNSYSKILAARLGGDADSLSPDQVIEAAKLELPTSELTVAAMLVNRDAGSLARSLEPFLGAAAQPIFGIGVLAMAISTILVHMMMNGYAFAEAFNKLESRNIFLIGASMPALAGFLSPIIWAGDSRAALAIPASVIATSLLPIAYLAFLLLMNSRTVLGEEMPKRRGLVNALLIFATGVATLGSVWALLGKGNPGKVGIVILAAFACLGIAGYFKRRNGHS